MDQKQYLNFRDMIDGGGAGAAGREFQGGGLLSMLGNLFARPLGSDAMQRPPERPAMPNMTPATLLQPPAPTGQTPPAPTGQSPLEMFGGQAPNSSPIPRPAPTGQSPLEMFGGQAPNSSPIPPSEQAPTPMSMVTGGRGTVTGPTIGQAFTQRLNEMFPPQQIERMAQRGDLERLFQQFVQTGRF